MRVRAGEGAAGPVGLGAETLGAGWLAVAARILAEGVESRYDGLPVREIAHATRLFDYEHSGRDQVAWVISRLQHDPASRSATITTFQPHTDTSYIPCVSLLDFWLPAGAVELVKSAHIYGTERAYMQDVLADAGERRAGLG